MSGAGCYVDDLRPPDLVHAAFVRSPHAHAEISAIRAPDSAPGLVAVITAANLGEDVRPLTVGGPPGTELADEPHPLLARDEVRYVGQPVAAVIARTRAQAEDAVELIEVDYQPLPAVVEPDRSERQLARWERSGGDVDAAFAAAAHVVRGRYGLPRVAPVPIEVRGAVSAYDREQDRLTVWCSAQDTHRPLAQLAHVLGRREDTIRVIVPDVGGAFGSKGVIAPEIAVSAIASMRLGLSVKWVEDRSESMLAAYQGRGMTGELELALSGDGQMLGLRARLRADLGAYLLATTAVPQVTAASGITGVYEIPAAAVTAVGVQTNKVPTGPYRGAGRPEASCFIERLVDDAARQLGVDRIELRRRNLIREFPYETPLGLTYDSGDFERCLDTALGLSRARGVKTAPGRLRGIGVAVFVERSGGMFESAEARLDGRGGVVIAASSSPHGQGHDITFAQIAADRLDLEPGQIELRFGDSAVVPAGVGTFGSRSVAVAGSAVALASEQLLGRARAAAAERLGVEPEALGYAGGRFEAGSRAVSLRDLGELCVLVRFDSERVFSSGAYIAEVSIETDTGDLDVHRIVAVDDAGTIINPLLARGQVVGGVAQGLGECLLEEVVHDADGQVRGATLMDYLLPSAAEMPEIVHGEVVSPTPLNPLGAKGTGEGGTIGAVAAISNAVIDALGGRQIDPPFTPEKLWRALRS